MCCERIVTHSEPHATWAQWVCLRAVNITIWKRPITIIYATQSIPTEHSPLSSSTTDCPNGRGNFPCFTNRSLPQTSHIGLWQPSSNHIPDWVCYTSLKTSNHSPDWVCYTSLKTSNHSSNWVCYTSLKTSNHIPDWVCYTTHLWKLPNTALTGYATLHISENFQPQPWLGMLHISENSEPQPRLGMLHISENFQPQPWLGMLHVSENCQLTIFHWCSNGSRLESTQATQTTSGYVSLTNAHNVYPSTNKTKIIWIEMALILCPEQTHLMFTSIMY